MRSLRLSVGTIVLALSLIAAPGIASAQITAPPLRSDTANSGKVSLSFEEPRRAGGPIWVHVEVPAQYSVQYPVGIVPGDFGCNEFEVRRDGVLLPRRGPDARDGPPPGGPPCGYIGIAGHPMTHPGRLPLHLQFSLTQSGIYEVRYTRKMDPFGAGQTQALLQSAWTRVELQDAIAKKIGSPPEDPAEILSDFLPGLLGYPDSESLSAVEEFLHHPVETVRQYAAYSLGYWPEDEVRRSLSDLVKRKGPSDVIVNRVLPASPELADTMIRYLASNDPNLVRGALAAARNVLFFDKSGLYSPAVKTAAEKAVLDAAQNIVRTGNEQTATDLASTLGSLRGTVSHDLLWDFVTRRVAYEQSLIAIAWHKDLADLPRLAAILNAPVTGDPLSTELASLPYALRNAFGAAALPVIESALKNSGYVWVQTNCARELISENRPAGFAFIADAIEQNRGYKTEMINFMQGLFPELRNADEADVLAFVKKRGA